MDVGASKKSGNSFHDDGNANCDSGGGSNITAADYATPCASASGDIGNSVYHVINNESTTTMTPEMAWRIRRNPLYYKILPSTTNNDDDDDAGNGMAYSTTVGATSYEPLPTNTDVES
jgi:hypothetical protein